MAIIEGFGIKNFRALKDIAIGTHRSLQKVQPLTPMTAVIGKNGVGKSTLFDAFGFLADCLKFGVEEACDTKGRGGFDNIRSQGASDPIEFEINYKQDSNAHPIIYLLCIDKDRSGRPYVKNEILFQEQKHDKQFLFLLLKDGKGLVWKGDVEGKQIKKDIDDEEIKKLLDLLDSVGLLEEVKGTEIVELEDYRKLGIATLGALKQHPRIAAFRRFIESWYLSYFRPDAARSLPLAGPQKHLNIHGDNLGNVVQFMEREHKSQFNNILQRIAKKIPGIDKIDSEKTADGRLLLRFNDKGFKDPFYAQQISDGTLKIFAYLLLLEDPTPPPFICIEEPENGLYHKLLETLAKEFRDHAMRKGGSQVFITTHQPYFVDALDPEEVWILDKGEDGFATIKRASDDPIVEAMVKEDLPLGSLWYSDYLDAR